VGEIAEREAVTAQELPGGAAAPGGDQDGSEGEAAAEGDAKDGTAGISAAAGWSLLLMSGVSILSQGSGLSPPGTKRCTSLQPFNVSFAFQTPSSFKKLCFCPFHVPPFDCSAVTEMMPVPFFACEIWQTSWSTIPQITLLVRRHKPPSSPMSRRWVLLSLCGSTCTASESAAACRGAGGVGGRHGGGQGAGGGRHRGG